MYFTYILRCSDGTFYTGYTNNLNNRIITHNNKLGAKYTRGRTPVELIYYECYSTKSLAMKREYSIKKLTKKEKFILVKNKKISIIKNG
ncbi:MAG TPA: GIY-YIG nuclease family protein [Tissierellaceae bacterium]